MASPIGQPTYFVSMPHAALWVVQPKERIASFVREEFQCRTRLCGWCRSSGGIATKRPGFNAARGYSLSPPPPLRGPPPPLTHGRLFSYGISASLPDARNLDCHIAPSQREGLRYFSFPHRYGGSGERSEPIGAPMPHAALWVVQLEGGLLSWHDITVSMPHAALWVVQPYHEFRGNLRPAFQCRTRLCGWCSFVALSSCPPKRKKAFWKVSGNLRCLTENM